MSQFDSKATKNDTSNEGFFLDPSQSPNTGPIAGPRDVLGHVMDILVHDSTGPAPSYVTFLDSSLMI